MAYYTTLKHKKIRAKYDLNLARMTFGVAVFPLAAGNPRHNLDVGPGDVRPASRSKVLSSSIIRLTRSKASRYERIPL